ncbi:cell surface glycoprotein CD200 receptor 1-A [Engraulis encrasicolus]|uniref:cell surface glycoprotein CD200 receptor 1-A n=1 Tax=Engraulis encrasicolus TaxID=184585 RepID=UPI002FD04299
MHVTLSEPPQNGSDAEIRNEFFEVGHDVELTCNNVTRTNALYYIWNINTTGGVQCFISEGANKLGYNNCSESKTTAPGKMLHNATGGETYLYIPSFTVKDEGMYTCETAYIGGAYKANITVTTGVAPALSTRREYDSGQWFAVCSAARGKPKATVSWEKIWDSPEVEERLTPSPEGTVTVESWLHLPDNDTSGSLTCVARHPVWKHKRNTTLELTNSSRREKHNGLGNSGVVMVASTAVLLIVVLVMLLSYAVHKHRGKLGMIVGHCCQPDVPSTTDIKENEEVEEVEPYESYVQRVNSIYNSSADLFGV